MPPLIQLKGLQMITIAEINQLVKNKNMLAYNVGRFQNTFVFENWIKSYSVLKNCKRAITAKRTK